MGRGIRRYRNYYTELVKLTKKKLKAKGKGDYNLDGKVMNNLMCGLENMVMVNFFHNKGLSAEVLCFDGLMIHKEYY